MMLDFFIEKLRASPDHQAFVSAHASATYQELLQNYEAFAAWLLKHDVPSGAVVSFDGDYSTDAIALMLALVQHNCIVVPLSLDAKNNFDEYRKIAETEYIIKINHDDLQIERTGQQATHPHYLTLREAGHAGLVLFSSGSTGKSKAIVQDMNKLMAKFKQPRKPWRMLIFLQLDHIGGVNSLLYSLANQGTVIVAQSRTPEQVCQAIETFSAELLPTSPTFLNLLSLSKAYEKFDLGSLKVITYGTEPMQTSTLERLRKALPHAQLQQTYGLSELGILRSKSRSSDSLWMKVGGAEFQTKIVDGTLRVKSASAMLGYLNAPSPFDEDGFMDTGDMVEQDGEWIRILGRESEIINVGGSKVFPAEVESVLLEMESVEDVAVFGSPHPITGQIVEAKVKISSNETPRAFKARMLQYCKQKLQHYKIPSKVSLTEEAIYNERFKRMRRKTVHSA